MIRRYLREHLPLAGLLALFAGTFALVLSLYHLPTEPVAYASVSYTHLTLPTTSRV